MYAIRSYYVLLVVLAMAIDAPRARLVAVEPPGVATHAGRLNMLTELV